MTCTNAPSFASYAVPVLLGVVGTLFIFALNRKEVRDRIASFAHRNKRDNDCPWCHGSMRAPNYDGSFIPSASGPIDCNHPIHHTRWRKVTRRLGKLLDRKAKQRR